MLIFRTYLLALLVGVSLAYRYYQDRIPNGDHVPHPCKANFLWRGVGHTNTLGGGERNPFGLDFAANGHQWTLELCQNDSDSDGMTNGEELGDPNCVWEIGKFPEETSAITHPGVCHPWGSEKCEGKNDWVNCEFGDFDCDGINSTDVFNVTLRFPETAVPPEETSYMCMTFVLDMLEPGVEYHLIATEPFTDNADVMHHTALSSCDATVSVQDRPERCLMANLRCVTLLGLWTLGLPGECVYKEAGFPLGGTAKPPVVIMQHHWTNPQRRTDYKDSSGMTLYLTKNKRKYNAGFLQVGQTHLEIPPGQDRVTVTGTCSPDCLKYMVQKPIYLMTGLNHMHYLGYEQKVEHFRNDSKLEDLTNEDVYSYDNPQVIRYQEPREVRPEDVLKTTCVYRSTSRTSTTYYGEGTYDEMCFGLFTFFPLENSMMGYCLSWRDKDSCQMFSLAYFQGCDLLLVFNASHPARPALFSTIINHCNYIGGCRAECPAAIAEVRAHPCFQGEVGEYAEDQLRFLGTLETHKFLSGLHSCECPTQAPATPIPPVGDGNTGTRLTTKLIGMTILVVMLSIL